MSQLEQITARCWRLLDLRVRRKQLFWMQWQVALTGGVCRGKSLWIKAQWMQHSNVCLVMLCRCALSNELLFEMLILFNCESCWALQDRTSHVSSCSYEVGCLNFFLEFPCCNYEAGCC